MASDVNSGKIPNASLVQGSQATHSKALPSSGGKVGPPAGKNEPTRVNSTTSAAAITAIAAASAALVSTAKAAAQQPAAPQVFVDQLNKHLNDSGRPDEFRLDPSGQLIQQVNPASGSVIGEFAATEFPALARSVGASGLLIDDLA